MSNYGLLVQPHRPSSTAYHEAGHGVIALFCNMTVERMTVLRRGNEAGACLFKPAGAAPILVAAVLLAGHLAERLANHYASIETANSDFTAAAKLVPGADFAELVFRTRRRLYSLWDEVSRVAEALDRDGELVGIDLIRRVAKLPSWL
jgi:hypothetical protein